MNTAYHAADSCAFGLACSEPHTDRVSTFVIWPIFLACSWTWCIGMYLPILLIERYGWWSVLAFTVPNVVGVMLFGRFMRTTERSRSMIRAHRPALLWFSAITVAFHGWFFGWIWQAEMSASPVWSAAIGVCMLLAAATTSRLSDRLMTRIALLVYALSLVLMALVAAMHWGVGFDVAEPGSRSSIWEAASEGSWMFLIPIMITGFLVCPYFDFSFHRAFTRVGGGGNGRSTFFMFGVFFAIVIGFTCLYALTGFVWPIVIHLVAQGWLTMTIHLRELQEHGAYDRRCRRIRLVGFLFPFGLAILGSLPWIDYRDWFVFYGIVFPTYGMLHGVRRMCGRCEANTSTVAAAIILSIPFGVAGFLMGQEWALIIPPVAVLLMAWRGGRRLPTTPVLAGDQ